MTALLAILTGAAAGAVFGFLRLPVPAPPSVVGVLGILGLWAGYTLAQQWVGH